MPKRLIPVVILFAAAAGGAWYVRSSHAPRHYTGFVEGEERVLRSEVTGRVLEVRFAEGEAVPPETVVAVLDDRDVAARIKSKQEEIAVLDAQLQAQEERIELVSSTWERDVSARRAGLRQAESEVDLAERTLAREQELTRTGASTAQLLDDQRARRDQARSARDRAREILGRAEAEERSIVLAKKELETIRQQRELARAQLGELQVTQSKYVVRSPGVGTVVQTQFIWPGELAQPGTAILSVLDPVDKYVQIYVPVSDIGRLHVGQRVEVELDSQPGRRVPGEVSFVADSANFTPEKIETRSDRLGQVYRVKVRILQEVERFQPGTEGDVYLTS